MATLTFSSCFFASRNSDASTVQPDVFALGKKNKITRLPRKSDSETSLPSSLLNLKSGALSPALSICNHLEVLLDCGSLAAALTLYSELQEFYESNRRKISFTACGFACPRVAFITWPTKNLNTPSLPPLYLATLSGFFAITSRAACSIAEVSVI